MFDSIPLIVTIIISYIPSFAWLGFVLSQDVHPEKAIDIAKAFILGSTVAVPVILFAVWGKDILNILSIELSPTVSSFVYGALMEEVLKGIFVYWFIMRNGRWNEPIDTFIYSATLALGFAGIENLAFVLSYAGDDFVAMQKLLVLRSLTSVIIHIISSFLVTYGIVLYIKNNDRIKGIWLICAGIVFHGLWNLAIEVSRVSGASILLGFYFLICIPLFIGMVFIIKHLKIISKT